MKQTYPDLSELLRESVPAEALFSQLPEPIKQRAMACREEIHSTRDLRAFARRCAREENL